MLLVVKLIRTNTVQTKKKRSPKRANCKGPHLANYRGCPVHKDHAFKQLHSPKPSLLCLHPKTSFTTTSQQHTQFYSRSNCIPGYKRGNTSRSTTDLYQNLPEKRVRAKSDLSKQTAETAKKCLGVNIEGTDVFESIISRPAAPPPGPLYSALC